MRGWTRSSPRSCASRRRRCATHSLTHSRTNSPPHHLTPPFTHALTHAPTHLTHSHTHSRTHARTHARTRQLTTLPTPSLPHSLTLCTQVAKVFGYTNDTNPFGDSNLLQPFVWGKKKEKDKSEGKVEKDDEESRLKLMKDIDRVRKRRVDRENELEEMERLRAEEQRLREASQYENWEEKEEEFHTQQTKVRSKIRLIEKREKPIDVLARHILLIESFNSTDKEETDLGSSLAELENLHVEMSEPLAVVENLEEEELRELLIDLDKYLEIEVKNKGSYVHFWTALKDVTAATLRQRKNRSAGVHKSVKEDVKKIMGGKVSQDLKLLLDDIRKSIREGKRSDVEYWEQMEQEVAVEYSRAIVREVHCDLLRQQLEIVTQYKLVIYFTNN